MKFWSGVALFAVLGLVPADAVKTRHRSGGVTSASPLFNALANFTRKDLDKAKGLTITMDTVKQELVANPGVQKATGIVWATMADRLNSTGWIEMHVDTSESAAFSNDVKMYSAGLVEGLLSAERMSQFYLNFYPLLAPDEDSNAALMSVRNVFTLELQYIERMAQLGYGPMSGEPADPYWKQIRYMFLQLWGLKDAYNIVANEKGVRNIDMIDMFFINSHAELPEMMQAYKPDAVKSRGNFQASKKMEVFLQEAMENHRKMLDDADDLEVPPQNFKTLNDADKNWKKRLAKNGHCSALVRVTNNFKDILVGHTTWNDFSKMTRVFKYYNFHLPLSGAFVKKMAFSSYPGCVSSTDDYYQLDSGLVIMDTSLEVLNPKVYDRVAEFPKNPKIPRFFHVQAINRIAKTGAGWTAMFAEANPGHGNSQWIIVDYNRFTPKKPIEPNTVRLLEMVPGTAHEADLSSELLSRGYWAGYNRPFFQDIRDLTGHTDAEKAWGALYSFEGAPRAVILKMMGTTVETMQQMRDAMNRNDGADGAPGVPGGPSHAISARLDLDGSIGNIPNGGIDAKVTNACLMKKLTCQAISGPPHKKQPIFKWKAGPKELFVGWPHVGLPNEWNFDYVEMYADGTKLGNSTIVDGKPGVC